MKNVKRLSALLFCLIMVLSLAACSSGGNNDDNSEDANNNTDDNIDSGEANNDDGQDVSHAEREFPINGGANQDTQVDNVIITMSSNSVNVGPFAPASPGSVGKTELYGKLFFQPYYGAPIEECIPWMAKSYEQIDD